MQMAVEAVDNSALLLSSSPMTGDSTEHNAANAGDDTLSQVTRSYEM
jgi:hypothetical protein